MKNSRQDVCIIVLSILLLISLICNVVQSDKIEQLARYTVQLRQEQRLLETHSNYLNNTEKDIIEKD